MFFSNLPVWLRGYASGLNVRFRASIRIRYIFISPSAAFFRVQKKEPVQGSFVSSDLPGARTQDPILKRDVLYLLS